MTYPIRQPPDGDIAWGGDVRNTIAGVNDHQTRLSAAETTLTGKAATVHTHAAADVTSGTVATARLGTGTASATTFLRGDQTWAAPAGGGGGYVTAQDEGTSVTARTTINFTGAGVTVTDNAAGAKTTVTIPGTGASTGPSPSGGNDATAVQNYLTSLGTAGGGVWNLNEQTFLIRSALTVPASVNITNGTLYFDTDLGAGVVGVTLTNGGDPKKSPLLDNVNVLGPSTGVAITLGAQAAAMDGIRMCTQGHLRDCIVADFRSNVIVLDNHEKFTNCKFTNGYYNMYWGASPTSFGNQTFINCDFTGPRFASMGVAPTNCIDFCNFFGGHCGFGPFGIYKETGTATKPLISSSRFYNFSFEAIGNSAIFDDATNVSSSSTLTNSVIDNPGFSWAVDMKMASRPKDYSVRGGTFFGSTIIAGSSPFTAGDVAAIRMESAVDNAVVWYKGDPVTNQWSGFCNGINIETVTWSGMVYTAGAAINTGSYLERNGYYSVRNYGTESGRGEMGVATQTVASGAYLAVAQRGEVDALCTTVSTTGVHLVPDETSNGRLRPVTSSGTNGYPFGTSGAVPNKYPIVATAALNGGSAGGALVRVKLGLSTDRTYVRPGTVTALPTASATYRGQMLFIENGTGVADGLYVCRKLANDTYAWQQATLT